MFFGLFRKKRSNGISDSLPKYLLEHLAVVDNEYMRSFSTKSTRVLHEFVSRDCAVKISRSIFSVGSRYFGAEKFRKTNWTLINERNGILDICKDVIFDKVKIGRSMRIEVADNYKELWVIDANMRNKPVVLDIQRM